MKKTFSATLLVVVLGCPVALACSCVPRLKDMSRDVHREYRLVDVVFIGTATQSTLTNLSLAGHQYEGTARPVEFQVSEALKGKLDRTVIVRTGDGGTDCGCPFDAGVRYLVYGTFVPDKSEILTSFCTRTKRVPTKHATARAIAEYQTEVRLLRSLAKPN